MVRPKANFHERGSSSNNEEDNPLIRDVEAADIEVRSCKSISRWSVFIQLYKWSENAENLDHHIVRYNEAYVLCYKVGTKESLGNHVFHYIYYARVDKEHDIVL